MPGQVNARLTPEHDAEFDRWAAELGVQRGKLAHDIIAEALAARREGRASFEQPETLGPGDVIAMKATLDRGVMEIDRIATRWAAHEAEMRKQERDDQRALTRARTEFIAGMPERITASLNPIRKEMAAFAERIDKQPRLDAIDERQREHTEALRANTAAIERLEKEPRVTNTYTIGPRDWGARMFGLALATLSLFLLGLLFMLAVVLPKTWLAAPTASLLLGGGDKAACALIDYQLGNEDCVVFRDGTSTRFKSRVLSERNQ